MTLGGHKVAEIETWVLNNRILYTILRIVLIFLLHIHAIPWYWSKGGKGYPPWRRQKGNVRGKADIPLGIFIFPEGNLML